MSKKQTANHILAVRERWWSSLVLALVIIALVLFVSLLVVLALLVGMNMLPPFPVLSHPHATVGAP